MAGMANKRTADKIAADILNNASDGWEERIPFETFKARAETLWSEAVKAGTFTYRRVASIVDNARS